MDTFDNIFIINLDERVDRWERIQAELKARNIVNYERYSAVKFNTLEDVPKTAYSNLHYNKYKKNERYIMGSVGCKTSHYNVIKESVERGYSKILILEDDTVIKTEVDVLEKALNDIGEWDMLYLSMSNPRSNKPFTNNAEIVTGAYTTNAYALNNINGIFQFILKYLENYGSEIDMFYVYNIHGTVKPGFTIAKGDFKTFATKPLIMEQSDSTSDIVPGGVSDTTRVRKKASLRLPMGVFVLRA